MKLPTWMVRIGEIVEIDAGILFIFDGSVIFHVIVINLSFFKGKDYFFLGSNLFLMHLYNFICVLFNLADPLICLRMILRHLFEENIRSSHFITEQLKF